MDNLQIRDRMELLSITRNLTLERKAELIFLHCIHGEEIIGEDKWYIDEIAELYGIRPCGGIYKNCYPRLFSFREIYNLMYTYPEGLEDREARFEEIILDINLNRALRYYASGVGKDMQPPLDSKYDKYEDYEGQAYGEQITAIENIFGEPKLKSPVQNNVMPENHKIGLIQILCIVAEMFLLWLVVWDRSYELSFLPETVNNIHKLVSTAATYVGLATATAAIVLMLQKRNNSRRFTILSVVSVIFTAILFIHLKLIPFGVGVLVTVLVIMMRHKYESGN